MIDTTLDETQVHWEIWSEDDGRGHALLVVSDAKGLDKALRDVEGMNAAESAFADLMETRHYFVVETTTTRKRVQG